jgi:hypothetical protein
MTSMYRYVKPSLSNAQKRQNHNSHGHDPMHIAIAITIFYSKD